MDVCDEFSGSGGLVVSEPSKDPSSGRRWARLGPLYANQTLTLRYIPLLGTLKVDGRGAIQEHLEARHWVGDKSDTTWTEMEKTAQDCARWRSVVDGLYSRRSEGPKRREV